MDSDRYIQAGRGEEMQYHTRTRAAERRLAREGRPSALLAKPTSRQIADAILRFVVTGARG
jgi:hypothetical protein